MARARLSMIGAVSTVLLSASPALAASDDAQIRFVHAVPGVGVATLSDGDQTIGDADFGEASDLVAVPAGEAKLRLEAPDGVKLSSDRKLAAGGSYTVVAMETKDAAELRLFENRDAKPGVARLRMIHAAPELGDADLAIGGKTVARDASYADETDYLQLDPGDYKLSVKSPMTGKPVLADNVPLAAGTSDTALIVGSQGEQTRVVLVEDDVATPAGAPATGFGGLATADDAASWPLALAAALGAGLTGLAAFARSGSRRRARPLGD